MLFKGSSMQLLEPINKKINSLYILSIPGLVRKSQLILINQTNSEHIMPVTEEKSKDTDMLEDQIKMAKE